MKMKTFRKKIRKNLVKIAKENPALRGVIRWSMNFYRLLRYKSETFYIKTDEKMVIFSCFGGKSYSCSPKAIYEYMVDCGEFEDYTFVWAFKHPKAFKMQLRPNSNNIVVKQGGKRYRKYIAKSKYWIFNYKVDDFLKPKRSQIFVQCWHGTPLKKLGCDLSHFDNVLNTMSGMKRRYKIEARKIDYFISPSAYATEKFVSAWNLKEIGKENIVVEEGYPRNDFLFNYTETDIEHIKKRLFGYYYLLYEQQVKQKKIILYAPTYRSNQHETGKGYVYNLPVDFDFLHEKLADDYIILFRPHYFIRNQFNFKKYEGFVYDASKIGDVNLLYIISDILVTDYSSVFFDYANLQRPMIFYMYDLEYYRDKSNGFYIDVEELPGKIVKSDEELVDEIFRVSDHFEPDERYIRFNEKYNYLDDGKASERVVHKIFF